MNCMPPSLQHTRNRIKRKNDHLGDRRRRSSMAGAKVEEEVLLPGFRFHPTDEELVGFYLARQVDGRTPAGIDHLIKHVDIYKYNPWDLPKANEEARDKECLYFFCKRVRKYNNSVRPNRVTGTGFWKVTGIDRPVYNKPPEGEREGNCLIIGLKKTLVYYFGSTSKGTKTEWMMHEFHLPPPDTKHDSSDPAEVWTVCRIFECNVMQKRYASGWREQTTNNKLIQANQNQCQEHVMEMGSTCYISFGSLPSSPMAADQESTSNYLDTDMTGSSLSVNASCSSNNGTTKVDQGFTDDDWDELRAVVGCAFDDSSSHQVKDD